MFLRKLTFAASLIALAPGCGPQATKRACVGGMGGDSALITDAALVRLDVYDATVQCQNGMLPAGAPSPTESHTFTKGQPIKLDVPPGAHALVLTTFSDGAGTMPLGVACANADLSAGSQVCFDLTLQPAPDLAVPAPDLAMPGQHDMSACGPGNPNCQCTTDADCPDPTLPRCSPSAQCVACLPTNDNCPLNRWCDGTTDTCSVGCKSSADCVALSAPDGGLPAVDDKCDVTRHTCVECLSNSDCPVGELCSQAGSCVPGCDLTAGKLCPNSLTCCNKQCIDTTKDPFNCGGCGNVCNNGSGVCCNSMCKNQQTDPDNCGGCGIVCSANGMATRTCSGSICNGTCAANQGDCNNNKQIDGCETNLLSTTTNCGTCGNNCTTTEKNVSGAFCNSGSCDYASCSSSSFGDCNGVRSDGCETNLTSTTNHCGSCVIDCTTQEQNATGVFCSSSSCNYTSCSATNFKDCNGNRTDGCETNTNTSTGNCGNCGTNCGTQVLNANGAYCNTGSCDYVSCSAANDKDCDMVRSNGCETDTNTNTSSCGACGRACSSTQVSGGFAATVCSGGLCTEQTCNGGFGNCTMPAAPTSDDGCETSTNDINHCGNCTTKCAYANAGASCPSGTCQMGACTATSTNNNFNCDGSTADGCECPGPLTGFAVGVGCCSATPSAAGTTAQSTGVCMAGKSTGVPNPSGGFYNYYDCYASGTYNSTTALDAATQMTAIPGPASGGWSCTDKSTGQVQSAVCRTSGNGSTGACDCWAYAITTVTNGPFNGTVGRVSQSASGGCFCPATSDNQWQ